LGKSFSIPKVKSSFIIDFDTHRNSQLFFYVLKPHTCKESRKTGFQKQEFTSKLLLETSGQMEQGKNKINEINKAKLSKKPNLYLLWGNCQMLLNCVGMEADTTLIHGMYSPPNHSLVPNCHQLKLCIYI